MPSPPLELTGKIFGRLTVVSRGENKWGKTTWNCICECGTNTIVSGNNITHGQTSSCGCLQKERVKVLNTVHGHSGGGIISRTYCSWAAMKYRCMNYKASNFNNYGGRGIAVCDSWKDSFENFLEDMGERPIGTSIDRIDNDGNYEPGNCRWGTSKEQSNNRRKRKGNRFGDKGDHEDSTTCLQNLDYFQ